MASSVQSGTQITDMEKATISEAMKEAQTLMANNNNNNNDGNANMLATVAGAMKNSQDRPMMLNKTLDGFGTFVVEPTETVEGHGNGAFVHRAPSFPHIPGGGPGPVIIGCKAAVIYGTYDKALPQLGWLLAWFKAQSSDDEKVYVEVGLLEELLKMEWSEVEEKLNASGSASRHFDSVTGTVAAAEIKDQGDKMAVLGASFDRIVGEREEGGRQLQVIKQP